MKALFIDATNKTVSSIDIENELQAMYSKIGCLLVQAVSWDDEVIVCDEEGRLKQWTAGFQLGDWRIVGNALIVGDTEDGDFADTKKTAEDVAEQIRFFGPEENLPEPEFHVFSF